MAQKKTKLDAAVENILPILAEHYGPEILEIGNAQSQRTAVKIALSDAKNRSDAITEPLKELLWICAEWEKNGHLTQGQDPNALLDRIGQILTNGEVKDKE